MQQRSRPKIHRKVHMKATQPGKPVAMPKSKNEPTDREPAVLHEQRGKRPRPSWLRTGNGSSKARLKGTPPVKPVATPKSKNELTDRELHEQRAGRPRWRSFTTVDNDLTRRDCQRARLKDALLTDREEETMEPTEAKRPEAVTETKYEPTVYERAVLAKQAERLKDQVRVARMKFVEDQRGGRLEFDHPDQAIASALLNEAFGTADELFAQGLLGYLCVALPVDENSAFEFPRADDLNYAISQIAAGKAVDELHARILADLAVSRITLERLLRNVSEPMRLYLSEELMIGMRAYKDNPKGEVKIDNFRVLEFSMRSVFKLMALCVELTAAADRYRATFESRKMQQLADAAINASHAEKLETSSARPERANAARARRLNGSAVHKLPQNTDSTLVPNGNGHTLP